MSDLYYLSYLPYAGVAFLLAIVAISGIRVANEYQRAVVLRLGRLVATRGPGLYYLIPVFERETIIDQRVVTADVEKQEAITKDNVPVKVDAVVWYRVTDPARAVVEVEKVHHAVTQTALTLLRNAIGQHTLDELLKEMGKLGEELRTEIDRATHPWGISVQMVEMKDVVIPTSMQRALAQEAEAEREKRARIIKAEAELEAAHRLKDAARVIMEHPAGLELRRMQMITEVGAEQNTTTIIMMPSEFVSMARAISEMAPARKTSG